MKKKAAKKSKPAKKPDGRAGNRIPKKPPQRIKGWDTNRWENSSSDGIA